MVKSLALASFKEINGVCLKKKAHWFHFTKLVHKNIVKESPQEAAVDLFYLWDLLEKFTRKLLWLL